MWGFSFCRRALQVFSFSGKAAAGKDNLLLLQRGWKKILQRLAESCQLLES
jgi:hypothetical protein